MRADRGTALLLAQAVAIVAVIWPYGDAAWDVVPPVELLATLAAILGVVVMLAAAASLGLSLRAHPAPAASATLRTGGLYRWVRHPIYSGLLSLMLGIAVQRGRIEPLVALAVLAVILHVKSRYEERLLIDHFGEPYVEYARGVGALVPGIGRYPAP